MEGGRGTKGVPYYKCKVISFWLDKAKTIWRNEMRERVRGGGHTGHHIVTISASGPWKLAMILNCPF